MHIINQSSVKGSSQHCPLQFLVCYCCYKECVLKSPVWSWPPCSPFWGCTGEEESSEDCILTARSVVHKLHMGRLGFLSVPTRHKLCIHFFSQCPTSTILWTATCCTSAEWISGGGGDWWSSSLRSLAWCQRAMTARSACASRTMTTGNTPAFSQVTH